VTVSEPVPLPDVEIRVDGARLPRPASDDVRAVTVEHAVGEPAWFALELSNWDPDRLQVRWSDGPLFAVGGVVEVLLGYVGALTPVLQGEITSLEPLFRAGRPPLLVVGGYDHGHRLTRTRRTRSFVQMRDSEIVAELARAAGLRVEAPATPTIHPYVVQANQTDWAFLRERAARIGHELLVRDKVLRLDPADPGAAAPVRLAVGKDITEFRPRLSAVGQVGEVAVRGWDVKRKSAVVGRHHGPPGGQPPGRSGPSTADAAFGSSTTAHVDLVPRSKAEADLIAEGSWAAIASGFVRGAAECGGDARLRAGTAVEITGAGTRFSGRYGVTAVTHTLDTAGYRTTLTVQKGSA
jgi:phage protein D